MNEILFIYSWKKTFIKLFIILKSKNSSLWNIRGAAIWKSDLKKNENLSWDKKIQKVSSAEIKIW